MMLYNYVSNDPYLINIYKEIDSKVIILNLWAYHGLSHIENVVKISESIAKQLKYDDELIDAIKTTAFLHDIGCINGKHNHEINGYEMAKQYFVKNNLNSKYKNEILLSIKYHRNCRHLNNPIAPILRFADKIDVTKQRVAPAGYKVMGMREYQHINKINIIISDTLKIDFIVDSHARKKEIEEYYFTKKIFKAIKKFAETLNKPYKIMYNGIDWVIK